MNLLLIDDHPLFAQSLRYLLAEMAPNTVISVASSISEALQQSTPIDLILLDLHLPDASGLIGLITVREKFPAVPVVMVSSEEGPTVVRAAIDAGAMGYVPKSSKPEVLMAAIQLILAGGTYLPSCLVAKSEITGQAARGQDASPMSLLTRRQREVLGKVIQGKSNKVIANELTISESTVKSHLATAFQALGVGRRTEAVFKVAQLGLRFDVG